MSDMTEDEYDALDELLTKTTPKVSGMEKAAFLCSTRTKSLF
jgi:hypothetical protein